MASIQDWVHRFEEKGGRGMRMLFVVVLVGVVLICYNWRAFRNMNNQEAMDAAQVARNLATGHGFTTDFIRPFSIHLVKVHNQGRLTSTNADVRPDYAQIKGLHPDLANPPVYPLVLAGAMKVLPFNYAVNLNDPFWSKPAFRPTPERPRDFWRFQPDFLIALLNQTILIVIAVLTFFLARRLFDSAVAWMSFAFVIGCEVLWHFSVTGLATMLLMLIFLGLIWCLVWIESEERDPVWSHRAQTWLALAIGGLLGVGTLTRYSFGWLVIPVLVYLGIFCVLRRWWIISLVFGVFLLVLTPWIWRNIHVSGTPFGTAGFALVEGTFALSENRLQRALEPDFRSVGLMPLIYKLLGNTREIVSDTLPRLGGSWVSALFLAGLLLSYRSLALRRLRYFLLATLLTFVIAQALGKTQLSVDAPDFNSENLLVLLVPVVFIYGAGLFFQLLEQMNLKLRELRYIVIGLFAIIMNLPMAFALISPQVRPVNYPPYYPPAIQDVAQYLRPNELMTSDIPWAVAWYGNRQCLWLPRNAAEQFYAFHDYLKPIRCLYLTPLTTDSRILTDWVRAGLDRSWPIFILESLIRNRTPEKFPLRYAQPGYFPEQLILWDYKRWSDDATPTAAPPQSEPESADQPAPAGAATNSAAGQP
jgi:hypothetical protein